MSRCISGLIMMVLLVAPALADNKPTPPKRVLPKGLNTLDRPPDLPYLPPFPGANYQSILSRPDAKGGPGFSLTFHTSQSSAEVMQFYKNAFRTNNWVLMAGDTDKRLTAMRKDTVCNITCMRPYKKGFQTQVLLGYKIFQKN